uniref:Uncharacterized protein n=1 Tax=Anguilla anguilla TaxID=7936 RepID=A0A0E9UB70_ANGAN
MLSWQRRANHGHTGRAGWHSPTQDSDWLICESLTDWQVKATVCSAVGPELTAGVLPDCHR